MKIKPVTKVGGIRLQLKHWAQLRELMQIHSSRAWLEKIIEREHKKASKAG
jgi:hypothetical protein